MAYLIAVGIIELMVGIVLLVAPEPFRGFCRFFDRVLWDIDKKVEPNQFWVGISELVLAAWLFYLNILFPEMAPILHPFWIIFLFFGVLYVFLPHRMAWLSKAARRKILPVDEYVMGARRISGFIFVVVSFYIFYLAYLAATAGSS